MHWWKQHPPGWYAWDRWYEDGEEGGGDESGGDEGGGDDGGDDSGGGGGDDGGDDFGDGFGGGGGGDDGDSGSDDFGDDSGGDFGSDDFDSDGDAGDDDAVSREWARYQREVEREHEQQRQQEEAQRERDRFAEEMERERQRQEEERRRQEEERRRAEAEDERQRQLAEQVRLAESYRLHESQQNGVNYGDQPGDVMFRNPLNLQAAQQPQSENVIMRHKKTGLESRLPRDQLQFVTNADEFDIRDDVTEDTARTSMSLETPYESPQPPPEQAAPPQQPSVQQPSVQTAPPQQPSVQPIPTSPVSQDPAQAAQARDDSTRLDQTANQAGLFDARPLEQEAPPGTTGQAGLFDSRPPETPATPAPAQQPASVPEQAAQNAAAAVAATGAPAETVAATAELAARLATDRQTLADQSAWTRAAFRSTYGDQADQEWLRQHEAELDRNQRLYGSREPNAGHAPLYGSPAGTPAAPNRRIGALPPPTYDETAQYGLPAVRAAAGAASPPAPAAAQPANALGLGAIGDQPAPTTVGAAAPAAPAAVPGAGWTPLPGQTARPPSAPSTLPATGATPPPVAAPPAATPPVAGSATGPLPNVPARDDWVRPPPTPGETGAIPIDPTQHGTIDWENVDARQLVVATGLNNVDRAFTLDEWQQMSPVDKAEYRDVGSVWVDPQGRVLAPPGQHGAPGQGGPPPTALPAPTVVTTIPQALASDRPIDALASMSLSGQGQNVTTEAVQRDGYHIAQGISALLSGKVGPDGKLAGAWTEPYLNDIARLAWAREEAGNGRTSDPRDAPVSYIEPWKDAFYGSDARVPMVKELNQQMIDYAATRTPPGQPFRWQEAYGPNGDRGLISRQVTDIDCGPNAFATILRSRGYNADPGQTFSFARQTGYHNGSEFTGPDNMVRMLRNEAGLNASSVPIDPNGTNWDKVDQELAEGRPVMLSSLGHYWVVSAKDPTTGKYYAGATTLRNNPEWMYRGGFRYRGDADRAIFASGDVDPNARAVKTMNLKPPASTARDTRALLSMQTTTGSEAPAQTMSAPADQKTGRPQAYQSIYEQKSYNAAVKAGHPDPIEFVEQMRHESRNFDPRVLDGRDRSPAGAAGIAQLIPQTYQSAKIDPFNVDQSLEYAATRMTNNYKTYKGDSERALAEYNMGAGNLQKYGPRGLNETNKYINIINNLKTGVKSGPLSEAEAPLSRAELLSLTRQPTGVGQRGATLAERAGGPYSYNEAAPFQDTQLEPAEPPPAEELKPALYPMADDPRVRAAVSEDVWSTRQPARQALMVDYQKLPFEQREAAFDRAMDEGLAAEGITGDEATRWKRAMYEIATGTGRLQGVNGENPALNPFMIAGESNGKPSNAQQLNSSATGYFQLIQTNRDGSDFGFMGYAPKEYNGNLYDPVAQVRQVIRAINASSNFRGNPDLAVADKKRKRHWDLIVQKREPY